MSNLNAPGEIDLSGGPFTHAQIAATLNPKHLELTILPTERCNLRCTYCYEDFMIGKMRPNVRQSLKNMIERRVAELDSLAISWFGGEPLVASDVVLEIAEFADGLCRQHDVEFHGFMTTNAFLLDQALFDHLVSLRQNSYQITLDGWGSVHDQVRKFSDGRGSFEQIWKNIVAAKSSKSDFSICLRIHIRRENIENLEILMDQIANEFGNDSRFTLDFQHLRDLGGDGGKSIQLPVSRVEAKEIENRLRSRMQSKRPKTATLDVSTSPSSDIAQSNASALKLNKVPSESNYICYAAKSNAYLIRADGRIGKCTVALNDDKNTIGSLNADGTLSLDKSKTKRWLQGLESREAAKLNCPLSFV